MPFAITRDNVRLHYEEVGSGTPLLFAHEFAGDWRAWEPQMRYFARRYRCITFSFRGYHPSDVPPDPSSYSYEHFRDDVIAMLDHLKIDKAHICGLSMGGYATLCVGIKYPGRALSLTLAGTGSGSERGVLGEFREHSRAIAAEYDKSRLGRRGEDLRHGPVAHSVRREGPARLRRVLRTIREPLREGRRQYDARLSGGPPAGLRIRGGAQDAGAADADHLRRRGRRLHRAERLSQEAHRDVRPRDLSEKRPHGEHRGARAVQPDARGFSRRWWMRGGGASAIRARCGRRRSSSCGTRGATLPWRGGSTRAKRASGWVHLLRPSHPG